ncbi:hypothetical protein ANN_06396 [Periplaneta americana]|uniref:Uncharacterized protein n=1 Tax=Periplaneta americana TaxID=6978 RepID=A0ABQ8TFY1_PERAM|nr:hypothetical protein ANN_06396 [Periplaneta americana]
MAGLYEGDNEPSVSLKAISSHGRKDWPMCRKTRNVTYAGFVVIITVIEHWSPTQSTVSSSSLARSPAESRSRAAHLNAIDLGRIEPTTSSTEGQRYTNCATEVDLRLFYGCGCILCCHKRRPVYRYSALSYAERVMNGEKFSPAPGFEPGFQLYVLMLYPLSHTGYPPRRRTKPLNLRRFCPTPGNGLIKLAKGSEERKKENRMKERKKRIKERRKERKKKERKKDRMKERKKQIKERRKKKEGKKE